jgi:hypothetical protein
MTGSLSYDVLKEYAMSFSMRRNVSVERVLENIEIQYD